MALVQGRLEMEAQCRGFLQLSKVAVGQCVGAIFGDTAFAELFHRLYCSAEWRAGTLTASIVATLSDYFADFQSLLEPSFFRRCVACFLCLLQPRDHLLGAALLSQTESKDAAQHCVKRKATPYWRGHRQSKVTMMPWACRLAEECLDETVAHYTAALVTYVKAIDDSALERMMADQRDLTSLFAACCSGDKVHCPTPPPLQEPCVALASCLTGFGPVASSNVFETLVAPPQPVGKE